MNSRLQDSKRFPRFRRQPVLIGGLACLAGLSALAARPGATLSGYERGGGSTAQKAVSAYVPLWATAKPDGGTAAADLGAARPRAPVAARVYLTERDPRGLAAYTAAVSDPGSTLYRHFLTPGQARQRFGPAPGQSAAVASWLRASGLRVTEVTGHYVAVTGTAAEASQAFGVNWHSYRVTAGIPQLGSVVASSPQQALPGGRMTVPAALARAACSRSRRISGASCRLR